MCVCEPGRVAVSGGEDAANVRTAETARREKTGGLGWVPGVDRLILDKPVLLDREEAKGSDFRGYLITRLLGIGRIFCVTG